MASLDTIGGLHYEMMRRCYNEKSVAYKSYGGKGIKVCEEWCGKDGFFNFKKWSINNGWSKGLSLDRIDNEKGYSPDNCRFATRTEQNFHRRSNIMYEYSGIMMPLGMIAKLEDVKYGLLYTRVRQKGMSVKEAISDIKKSGS